MIMMFKYMIKGIQIFYKFIWMDYGKTFVILTKLKLP
jgi:hypothetical protein